MAATKKASDDLAEFVRNARVIQNPDGHDQTTVDQATIKCWDIMEANGLIGKAVKALYRDGMNEYDKEDVISRVKVFALKRLHQVDLDRDDKGDGGNNPMLHVMDISIKQARAWRTPWAREAVALKAL